MSDNKNPWKTINKKYIYENSFGYKLRIDEVLTPAGTKGNYGIFEGNGYVAIVALTKDNQLILVRQWRYPVEEESLEIPSGILDAGLTPLEAAKKELSEEVGGESDDWIELGNHWLGNGAIKIKGYLFLAKNVVIGSSHQHLEEEKMTTEFMPFSEGIEKVVKNEFSDERTQLAILLAAKKLEK
jgi:ADP-ribose pyrophosphatase